ncbi:hypothetical protein LCGC14_1776600 [marine sediment metagenome]|uniref:DUF5681 domain-containing protein n=1 Tax=marine sediment metagenome TaxID=412755 RepID=A0A0F9HJ75_9ZZZZ
MKKDKKGRVVYKPKKGQPSRFPKGVSGNLKGRPKGSGNKLCLTSFVKAIKYVEEENEERFMISWLRSAWGDSAAMSEIANYMLPKLRSIEGLVTTFESSMDDDLAKKIQDELRERYK